MPSTNKTKRNGRKTSEKASLMDSPELLEVGRELASIALLWTREDRRLNVRQREQLRRVLARASEELGWGVTGDGFKKATQDLVVLADAGAEALEQDLVDQIAGKHAELPQLERVARSVQKLAGDKRASWPAEIEYAHTARQGSNALVTKVQTRTVADASEAQDVASMLEKGMEGWAKLRDQMLEELEDRRAQIGHLRKHGLPPFLETSHGLVREVLAVAY